MVVLLRFVRHPRKCPLIPGGHLRRAPTPEREISPIRRKSDRRPTPEAYAAGRSASCFKPRRSIEA